MTHKVEFEIRELIFLNTFDLHTFAKCPLLWNLKHTTFLAEHMLLAWINRPQKVHNLLTLDVTFDTLSVVESVEDLSTAVAVN